MRNMRNPLEYGGVVSGEAFCNREKETGDLVRAMESGEKLFAGDFVSRHGLGSGSNAQRAVQALLSKDVIDRDNGSFLITDRFFRLWIQSVQSA